MSAVLQAIITKRIKAGTKGIIQRVAEEIHQKVTSELVQWRVDVLAWLDNISNKTISETSNPLRKTGQLRKAAGHYSITKKATAGNSVVISVITRFDKTKSYSKNQRRVRDYSAYLEATPEGSTYYGAYKTRYRRVLYKRLDEVVNGKG